MELQKPHWVLAAARPVAAMLCLVTAGGHSLSLVSKVSRSANLCPHTSLGDFWDGAEVPVQVGGTGKTERRKGL